jgi:hypothetical protein
MTAVVIPLPVAVELPVTDGGRLVAWVCPDGQGVGVDHVSRSEDSAAFVDYFPTWPAAFDAMRREAVRIHQETPPWRGWGRQ